jgi:hypothetical protein
LTPIQADGRFGTHAGHRRAIDPDGSAGIQVPVRYRLSGKSKSAAEVAPAASRSFQSRNAVAPKPSGKSTTSKIVDMTLSLFAA